MTSRQPLQFSPLSKASMDENLPYSHALISLQLPFMFLGVKDVPSQVWSSPERHTKPIDNVQLLLLQYCPTVRVLQWIPERMPDEWRRIPANTTMNKKEKIAYQQRKREEWADREAQRWKATENSDSWIVRRAQTDDDPGKKNPGIIGEWRPKDGCLTHDEERKRGRALYACPVILQRFRTPEHILRSEIQDLLRVLRMFNSEGEIKGQDWFRIITSSSCYLKLSFTPSSPPLPPTPFTPSTPAKPSPHAPENAHEKGYSWPIPLAATTLLLLAALEREATPLIPAPGLVSFYPLSRFLLYSRLRALQREKQARWARHAASSYPSRHRRQRAFAKDEEAQRERMAGEEDAAAERRERLGLRDEGFWRVVEDIRGEGVGGEGVGRLLREMREFEKRGGRVGVSFFLEEDEEKDGGDEGEGEVKSVGGGSVSVQGSLGSEGWSVASSEPPVVPPRIKAVVFNTWASTLDAGELLAYVDLASRVVEAALTLEWDEGRRRVERYRNSVDEIHESPLKGLKRAMGMLGCNAKNYTHFHRKLAKYHLPDDKESGASSSAAKATDGGSHQEPLEALLAAQRRDPFYPLLSHISHTLEKARSYVPEFIERYEVSGGYRPIPDIKLYALMVADERERHEVKLRREADAESYATVSELEKECEAQEDSIILTGTNNGKVARHRPAVDGLTMNTPKYSGFERARKTPEQIDKRATGLWR
ncbi:hypothetical protein BS50DRAFT_127288 [Corynespora cassiicola Philippines]|uniref:Uncharacterized protein n=1 Tax=Corynespora cassiicola Philippines TaxID=1448308 RepID=A0A2T2NBS4_CORCC|nr:hypothetical protein BS50DRAFT_127288 [Corynespora cassiicola Philippines]